MTPAPRVGLPRPAALEWLALGLLTGVELVLFRQHVHTYVAPFYPVNHDQLPVLEWAYRGARIARDGAGLGPAPVRPARRPGAGRPPRPARASVRDSPPGRSNPGRPRSGSRAIMRPIVESASVRTRARAAATACPGCGGRELRPVYSRSGVPVHQNIAAPTQAEALRCPRGDIALAHCAECGLVFNAAFDETLVRYAPGYDASQSHSPLFGRYLDELARDLVARHSLHGKTVVEIGCGAGDFLARLCRIGAKEGIGFDPSYAGRPDRLPPGVTVRAEAYPPGRPHPPAHLVCARHVLEHIARPAAFLAALRGAAGNPDGAPVFVETPRLEWILEQHAFWDVFYEHCSYFTAPVLRRLLETAGLAVARAGPTFGGQYQFVEARPGRPSRAPLPPDGEAPAALAARLEAFARDADTRRAEWGARLGALSRRGGCLVWGAGAKGVTFLNALDAGPDTVPAVVDLNPAKQGRYVPGTGQPIIAPSDLHRYPAGSILVMNSHYLEEIQALARVEAPGADVLSL